MLPNIGFGELLVVFLVILLLFGARRLPELAKGMGRSLKAFKEGLKETTAELEDVKRTATDLKGEPPKPASLLASTDQTSRNEENSKVALL